MQPQDPEPGSSEHEAETRSNIVVMQDRQSCAQKELRRRPARGETHVLTFSLEGLAYHTDAWVVRLCFRVFGDCLMRRIDMWFVCVGFHVARICEFGCLDLSKTFPVRL